MTIYICYYERKSDHSPDYDKQHTKEIHGKNAKECMDSYTEMLTYHNCFKYSRPEIYDIKD